MAYSLPREYIHAFNVMHATKLPALDGYFFISPRSLTSEQRLLIIEGFEFWGLTSITSSSTMLARVDDKAAWLYFTEGGGVAMSFIAKSSELYSHLKVLAPMAVSQPFIPSALRRSDRLASKIKSQAKY